MIVAKKPESQFTEIQLPDTGTTQAVCCGVWDIGLQKSTFNGEEKTQHKVIIAWEIAQLINAPESEYNGKPYMLTQKYTLSLSEKSNLRRDLESWRGKPFTDDEINNGVDLETLYGVNCLLGVKHEPDKKNAGKFHANISAILPPVKGSERLQPVRGKNDPAPKWVLALASNAALPPLPAASADFPFGDPEQDYRAEIR